MTMTVDSRTAPQRPTQAIPLFVAATTLALLSGCATRNGIPNGSGLADSIDPAYQDWFDGGRPADMDSMDWGRIEFARQAAERGNTQRAIRMLQAMTNEGFSPAYYELGKLYEDGAGVSPDPARAAGYYGEALRIPSPILGNASLRLGRLYRDGEGVARNETLAYHLFRQAVDEDTGPNARVALAEMLVGGRGIETDTQRAAALYSQAADAGDAQALEALAMAYSSGGWLERDAELAGEYAKRYAERLKARAEHGDAGSLARLAKLYDENGLLGPRPEAHRHWLMRAAEADHAGAMGEAGEILLAEGDASRGLALLRNSAEAGNEYAMADLGKALLERDPTQARRWLTAAADQGSVSASAALGRAYLHGTGLAVDRGKAVQWLTRAAQAEHAGAAATLGRMYLRGEGVGQDIAKGAAYLERAVARGHAGARSDLGELLLSGKGIAADPPRGASLLAAAARAGDANAARSLGVAYLEGAGVEHDPQQAKKWLTQAAEAGHLPALNRLGRAYLHGEKGLQQDVAQGHALLLRAAEQGHAGAQAALGREYLRGELLEKDRERGAQYLYQAAQQGHPTARLALAKAYLWANGLEEANQRQALLWLENVFDGDSRVALETMRQLLTEADDRAVAKTVL